MDNQDKQSSWDDLARELGADAPAEPTEIPKTTYVKTTEPEERRKAAEPPARPKPTPKSWDNLAADLGLEVPPPPPEPVEKPKPARPAERVRIEPESSESTPPRSERTSRPERPRSGERSRGGERPQRRERSAPRDEAPTADGTPQEADASEGRPPRRSRGGRSRGGRGGEGRGGDNRSGDSHRSDDRPREDRPRGGGRREDGPRQERERRPREEASDEPREELRVVSPPPVPEPEPPAAPSLGVSLWHKIFGSPDQQAERIAESSNAAEAEREIESEIDRGDWRRDKRRGRDDDSRDSLPDGEIGESIEVRETWESESIEFARDDQTDGESRPEGAGGEEGDDRPRRRRRGRGRGRGRGRRSDAEGAGDERSAESPVDRAESPREPRESGGQREPRGRGRGGRSGRPRREDSRRREAPHDSLDDDGLEEIVLDDDQDNLELAIEGEEPGGRDAPAGHKSIPSWEEAIGMIVEINLSTRTDRRRSSAPQTRGSGSRGGRSRGGRRRKKPS